MFKWLKKAIIITPLLGLFFLLMPLVGAEISSYTLLTPVDQETEVEIPATLSLNLTEAAEEVAFYGRETGPIEPFTIVAIPDTQNYAEDYPTYFDQQMEWVINNEEDLNIVFVVGLGDFVNHGSTPEEWVNVEFDELLAADIPHGFLAGNHDFDDPAKWLQLIPPDVNDQTARSSTQYSNYFDLDNYQDLEYWGGEYSDDNTSNYQVVSIGMLKLLFLNLEFNPHEEIIEWAQEVLAEHPDYRVILSTHMYTDTFSGARTNVGENIWENLVDDNCQIFMVLSGHLTGQKNRGVTNSCGQTVYEILQNYEDYGSGGDGYLRYFTFNPAENKIEAYSYSPVLDNYRSSNLARFTLPYNSNYNENTGSSDFALLGEITDIGAGEAATLIWEELVQDTEYEWYAEIDGEETAHWTFITAPDEEAPIISNFNFIQEQTSVSFSWATSEEATYTLSCGESSVEEDDFSLTNSIVVHGLESCQTYNYQLIVQDAAENQATKAGSFQTLCSSGGTGSGVSYNSRGGGGGGGGGSAVKWDTTPSSNTIVATTVKKPTYLTPVKNFLTSVLESNKKVEATYVPLTPVIEKAAIKRPVSTINHESAAYHFTDWGALDSWQKNAVADLFRRGIFNGRANIVGEYEVAPNDFLKRAEMVKIILLAFNIPASDGLSEFSDVQESDWFAPWVQAAKNYGVIEGYRDNTFRPYLDLTKEESLVITLRAAGIEVENGAAWYDGYLNWAKQNSIVDGSFQVGQKISRAEMAALVSKILNYLER